MISRLMGTLSGMLLCGAAASVCAAPPIDPVLEWNLIAIDAGAVDHSHTPMEQPGPTRTSRALAIVHCAMYDALNSIDGTHQPYFTSFPMGKGASIDAAVAQAAHDTLVALYPSQTATFDAALAQTLSRVTKVAPRIKGQLVGKMAAKAIQMLRIADGSEAMMNYQPGELPGEHRVDPLNPMQGFLTPDWGKVRPFAIASVNQFLIAPPPALTSAEYADAFNEVKDLGAKHSLSRTEEQTIIGIYWAYDGTIGLGAPPRLYNQIARVIAVQQNNTPVQNARLFALINIAMADAGIACWHCKYLYDYWRPVVGIREADPGTGPTGLGDGNPETVGDVNWEPLGAPASNGGTNDFTPPFPAYGSGHATFGAALFTTLERFYGTDAIPFSFMSDEYNGVTTDSEGVVRPAVVRSYNTLSEAMIENALSRIYLGVHWIFDATAGVEQGQEIAHRIFNTRLRPK
jgi:hypothetical protein